MFYIRITTVGIVLAASIASIASAQSLETFGHKSYSHKHHESKSYYGGDGVPSYLRGIGTYSGVFYANRAPQNGNYFTAESLGGIVTYQDNAAKPRIIHVDNRTARRNCSYEAGVCVIRP